MTAYERIRDLGMEYAKLATFFKYCINLYKIAKCYQDLSINRGDMSNQFTKVKVTVTRSLLETML